MAENSSYGLLTPYFPQLKKKYLGTPGWAIWFLTLWKYYSNTPEIVFLIFDGGKQNNNSKHIIMMSLIVKIVRLTMRWNNLKEYDQNSMGN